MLEVRAPNKGMLITRVALTGINDVTTIQSPAVSLLVYNTATTSTAGTAVTPGFYYWNGSAWMKFNTGAIADVPEVVNMRGVYNAAATYAQNDLVATGTNRDIFYFSLTPGNAGNAPGSSPGFWQPVEVEQLKQIHKTLGATSSGSANLLSFSLSGTNTVGGKIQYVIRASDGGTHYAAEQGVIQFVSSANSITCTAPAAEKINFGTVGSACNPLFFSPGPQPGVGIFDNVSFSPPAAVTQHDVYFRISCVGGQLANGSYSKVRLRIEP